MCHHKHCLSLIPVPTVMDPQAWTEVQRPKVIQPSVFLRFLGEVFGSLPGCYETENKYLWKQSGCRIWRKIRKAVVTTSQVNAAVLVSTMLKVLLNTPFFLTHTLTLTYTIFMSVFGVAMKRNKFLKSQLDHKGFFVQFYSKGANYCFSFSVSHVSSWTTEHDERMEPVRNCWSATVAPLMEWRGCNLFLNHWESSGFQSCGKINNN